MSSLLRKIMCFLFTICLPSAMASSTVPLSSAMASSRAAVSRPWRPVRGLSPFSHRAQQVSPVWGFGFTDSGERIPSSEDGPPRMAPGEDPRVFPTGLQGDSAGSSEESAQFQIPQRAGVVEDFDLIVGLRLAEDWRTGGEENSAQGGVSPPRTAPGDPRVFHTGLPGDSAGSSEETWPGVEQGRSGVVVENLGFLVGLEDEPQSGAQGSVLAEDHWFVRGNVAFSSQLWDRAGLPRIVPVVSPISREETWAGVEQGRSGVIVENLGFLAGLEDEPQSGAQGSVLGFRGPDPRPRAGGDPRSSTNR